MLYSIQVENIRKGANKMKVQKITAEQFNSEIESKAGSKTEPAIKVYHVDSNPKMLMDQFPMLADWYLKVPHTWVEAVATLLTERKFVYRTIDHLSYMAFAVIYQRG